MYLDYQCQYPGCDTVLYIVLQDISNNLHPFLTLHVNIQLSQPQKLIFLKGVVSFNSAVNT